MNSTFNNFRLSYISALFVFAGQLVFSQMSKPGYDDKLLFRGLSGVTVGAATQSWTFDGLGTVSQQSAPISLAVPLSNRILFAAASTAGMTQLGDTSLSGIVDTRLSLSYMLPGDRFWLTAGASLPTGKTELGIDELNLMTKISQTSLAFKIPVFGQGAGGNFGLAYGSSFTRRLVFGLGASYAYRGKYIPVKGSSEYDPGDELSGNIGLDYITYSKEARFSADLSVSYFFVDTFGGDNIFQSGPRFVLFFVYSLKRGDLRHLVSVRTRYRLKNTFYDPAGTKKYDATTQVEGQNSCTIPINGWLTANAVAEGKYYTADQVPFGTEVIETGTASIGSVGGDFLFAVSDIFFPVLNVRYARGSVKIDRTSYDVNGFEAGLGVKISF
jgi:hypothetical protein